MRPQLALALLLGAALWCRLAWLTVPSSASIFDEVYYVNATRVILGWHVAPGDHYAGSRPGLDPNREHPPLGKAIMAASMRVFGDDAYGWRLPSVVAGMLAILLLYGVVRAGGGDAWTGVLAAVLLAFDNLVLIQSRTGMLDMMLVLFLLFGAWCYLQDWPVLAGAGLALAADVKISGLYGLLAILLFELARTGLAWWDTRRWSFAELRRPALMLGSFLLLWIGMLWLLDLRLSVYHNPLDHLRYILQYGVNLTRQGGPANEESYPWQWLANDAQLNYFNTIVTTTSGSDVLHRYTVNFRGAMNPVIIGSAAFGFCYAAWRAWRLRDPLSIWIVTWVIGTYLPYYPLIIVQGRIGYLYYFLPTLPAIAAGLAQFLRLAGLPRPVVWGYLALVMVGFMAYFPFRTIPAGHGWL